MIKNPMTLSSETINFMFIHSAIGSNNLSFLDEADTYSTAFQFFTVSSIKGEQDLNQLFLTQKQKQDHVKEEK